MNEKREVSMDERQEKVKEMLLIMGKMIAEREAFLDAWREQYAEYLNKLRELEGVNHGVV